MKKAIICFNCKKLKKESESYKVKVHIVEKELNNPTGVNTYREYEVKTRICRGCAKKMGYKVKVAKPKPLK